MPIARRRGICQASNAFSVARFVSHVFLDPTRGHRQRCFSNRTTLYSTAGYAFNDESGRRVGQVRTVSDENNASAVSFNPIDAARRRLARQRIASKLQASLDPTSLEKTLEKHRAVNMGAIVKHVVVDRNAEDFERTQRRKPRRAVSEKSNANEKRLEIRFDGDELVHDAWFEHLDVSTVPTKDNEQSPKEEKADKIIKSKLERKRTGTILEYKGRYVNPISKPELDHIQLPWAVAVDETSSALERLDAEIIRFWDYIRPTKAEMAARHAVMRQTQTIIQEAIPEAKTETFGSQRTGLVLASSDLDLRIFEEDQDETTDPEQAPRHKSRKARHKLLWGLHQVLDANGDYILCHLRYARYPLISTQHKHAGLDVQIVCANDTSHSRNVMQEYLSKHKDLAALFAVLKIMLDIRGLSDVFRGGIGSYSLFMMVVASLELWARPIHFTGARNPFDLKRKYGPFPKTGIGAKLLHFLEFYSVFDSKWNAIALQPPQVYKKKLTDEKVTKLAKYNMEKNPMLKGRYKIGLTDHTQPYLLCLQDPADPLNDLGRQTFGIKHIFETIRQLRVDLELRMADPPKAGESLLEMMVGPAYGMLKGRRKIMADYGSKFL